MSYRVKMLLPVVGTFLLGCAVVAAVRGESREIKQPLPPSLDDLAAVRLVEVRDAAGQIVLGGSFKMATKKTGISRERRPWPRRALTRTPRARPRS
jgi:hypothetical protein